MCGHDAPPPTVPYRTPRCLQATPTSAGPAAAGAGEGRLVVEEFPLEFDGYVYKHARIAYVTGRPPAPVVLVHPNYAGLKQFDADQAAFLARVGYVGLAVDLFKEVPEYTYEDRNPPRDDSTKAARDRNRRHFIGAFTFYDGMLRSPKLWRSLMAAYMEAAAAHPAVRPGLAAAMGYCFGGQSCLEQVRAGHNLQAVVSFHGLLQSRPIVNMFAKDERRMTAEEFAKEIDVAPNTYNTKCKVLIENGDLDDHVPQSAIDEWKAEMDAHSIDWRFNNHARTPHGFALAPGVWSNKYTELVDRRSTLSMLSLFAEVWPDYPQYQVETNACGTVLGQQIVPAARSKI